MKGRRIQVGVGLLSILVLSNGNAQFAGFVSASYGFHSNPLYNYERLSDQLKQAYIDLSSTHEYEAAALKFNYVSGLMIFNRFTDRNYYEHNLHAKYSLAFRPDKDIHDTSKVRSGGDRDFREEMDSEWAPPAGDSCGSFLEIGARVGGRHDKEPYKDFDNVGLAVNSTFRTGVGEFYFLRVTDIATYRRYVYIDALTNVTNDASVQFGRMLSHTTRVGVALGGGVKHYTTSRLDTARIETQRTYALKSTGKGKGGAKIKIPSSKLLLVNSETNNIVQLSGEVFFLEEGEERSIDVSARYLYNPGSATRYLAQYASTSILSDDVYSDKFSYEGPVAEVRLVRMLPLRINAIVTLEGMRKRFGAPALNLIGEQMADNRIDVRTRLELYLSRYIEIASGLAMDVAFAGEIMRNQSNDDYSDFSLYQFSASIGIGF